MTQRMQLDYDKLQEELILKLRELSNELSIFYKDKLLLEQYYSFVDGVKGSISSVNAALRSISEKIPQENLMRVIVQRSNITTLKVLNEKLIPNLILEINSFLKNPLEIPNNASTESYEKIKTLCNESLELLGKIQIPLEERLKGSTVDELKLTYDDAKESPSPTSKK